MVVTAAHQVEIGRRQYRYGDAGIGEPRRDFVEALRWQQRHLGDMADGHPAAPAEFLGLAADIFDLHALRGLGEIKVHIDFGIDRPGIVTCELLDRLKADHSYSRIKLDMGAHPHGALRDAAFQRLPAAPINVLDGEAALRGGGLPHSLGDGALFDAAAVENAGLVEMDVRLDHAWDDEAARGFQFGSIGLKRRSDRRDRLVLNGDIGADELALAQNASVTNDQVHQFTTAGTAPRYASSSIAPRNSAALPCATTRPPPST